MFRHASTDVCVNELGEQRGDPCSFHLIVIKPELSYVLIKADLACIKVANYLPQSFVANVATEGKSLNV